MSMIGVILASAFAAMASAQVGAAWAIRHGGLVLVGRDKN